MILNGEQVLEQILEDKVIDLNNPSCNNCNECCSILTMISEEEYKFYKKYFKKNNSILKAAKERKNKLEVIKKKFSTKTKNENTEENK